MRVRIRLDTITDIAHFVLAVHQATGKEDKVYVTAGERICMDAKSFLGLIATKEFNELWCESEKDIYTKIKDFVVEEDIQ